MSDPKTNGQLVAAPAGAGATLAQQVKTPRAYVDHRPLLSAANVATIRATMTSRHWFADRFFAFAHSSGAGSPIV